jgi:2-keto-3-deoxy-L-rhamnonate aldolase RhmA
MKNNKLRELLKQGKPSIGTHVHSVWPGIWEVIGHAGTMDYVEFLAEYASYTLHDLENMARAIELFNMSSMIKVDQANQVYIAQKALGAGFQNVLFVDIRSVDDVKDCVRAVRAETPSTKGILGCAYRRDSGWILEGGSENYVKAMNEVVVAVMIEKKSAVDDIERICAVKGLDMVQFGPCDYSMSIDKPGKWKDPEVQKVERKMIKTALNAGVAPRVEINPWDMERCKEYMEMGVKHFSIGWELIIIYEWIKEKGGELRRALSKRF